MAPRGDALQTFVGGHVGKIVGLGAEFESYAAEKLLVIGDMFRAKLRVGLLCASVESLFARASEILGAEIGGGGEDQRDRIGIADRERVIRGGHAAALRQRSQLGAELHAVVAFVGFAILPQGLSIHCQTSNLPRLSSHSPRE